jgi:hypothetical protein
MPEYVVTVGALEDAGLRTAAAAAGQDPTAYLTARINDVLSGWARDRLAEMLQKGLANYPNLTAANRQAVLDGLGLGYLSTLTVARQVQLLGKLGPDAFRAADAATQDSLITLLGV